MVNEFVYCPRLFFYEWVEGVFAHSADTVEGALRHETVDRTADPLPAPAAAEETERLRARSVELASRSYDWMSWADARRFGVANRRLFSSMAGRCLIGCGWNRGRCANLDSSAGRDGAV